MLTPSNIPLINTLLLTTLILALYYTYGKTYLYRDPNGIFYDSDRAYEKKYSLQRELEGLNYLNRSLIGDVGKGKGSVFGSQAPLHDRPHGGRRDDALVCAVIVSFGDTRHGAQHPLQVGCHTFLLSARTDAMMIDVDSDIARWTYHCRAERSGPECLHRKYSP